MLGKLLDVLSPWRWLLLAGLLAALIGYHLYAVSAAEKAAWAAGDAAGAERVQAQYDTFKGDLILKSAQLIRDAAHTQDGLVASLQARQKELKNEESRLTAERDAALASLRERPDRPAGGAGGDGRLPGEAGAGAVAGQGTGAGLYRSDAEFLVREAARAELIRSHLLACYAAVDGFRAAQERFMAAHPPSIPDEP
jgi:hypothetical protein